MTRRPLLPLLLAALSLPALTSCHISNRGMDFSPLTDRFEPAVDDDVLLDGDSRSVSAPTATPTSLVFQDSPAASAASAAAPQPAPLTEQELAPAAPVAAAPAPVAAPAAGGTYTVKAGDTLSAIAARHHTTYAQLAAVNGIAPTATLKIGQTLRLPAAGTAVAAAPKASAKPAAKPAAPKAVKGKGSVHTVKAGETLYAIARKNGISPAALMQANHLTPQTAGKLSIGTTLTIPAK